MKNIINYNQELLLTMNQVLSLLGIMVCLMSMSKTDANITTHTTYGSLSGKRMKSRSGRDFIAFLGVPFASPPIGPLRFMPPKPPQRWSGVRSATTEGNACVQRKVNGYEDCLYLNVFTHNINTKLHTNLSSVMVYIHGGGFYGGSASLNQYGPEYLMDRSIVLVTLQYRLGVFGFLSTEDSVVPGNMGLKDQLQALHWVQENIQVFGGDRLKVTIFGNSAGAASVHLHMISPQSQGLFARAISQSGTALSAFAFIGKGTSRKITLSLAQKLRCPSNSSQGILQCLQSRNSTEIQQEYSDLQDDNYEIKRVLFRPVVEVESEHAFLTISPLNASSSKPWLVGFNANEGLFKINTKFLNETIYLINTEHHKFFPSVLFFDDTCSKPSQVATLIYNFYFKNDTTQNETITSLEQVISDSWFIWPTMQAIERHHGITYCYLFEHQGEDSFTRIRGGPQGLGVSHMDEIHYILSQRQYFSMSMTEEDTNISKLMVNLWVNFAEEINPTSHFINDNPQEKYEENFIWEATTNNNEPNFCHIETKQLSMLTHIYSKRINFWKSLPIKNKLDYE